MIPQRKQISWTSEQQAIFAHFAAGPSAGHAIVKARAGSGKTTTVKEAITNHAKWARRIIYLVFNKRNQLEAEAKIKDHRCEVRTFHSIGFQFVKKVWPAAKPDNDVEFDRARAAAINLSLGPLRDGGDERLAPLLKLVSLAKNTGAHGYGPLSGLLDAYDVDYAPFGASDAEARKNICLCADEHLKLSRVLDTAGRISFDDMVWLPVVMGWTRKLFDLVVVDETQDMNDPQLAMARAMCKDGGMIVAVGDDFQTIYGFRGCCQDGLETMRTKLDAKTLTLTVTQRNPKLVVAEAIKLVPDFKFRDGAPDGEVLRVKDATAEAKVGDAILSRLNAPLMPTALALLRAGKPARIEGRDIGKQLITMTRSLKASSVESFLDKLQMWENKQVERLSRSRNAEKKIEQAKDIAATLRCVAEVASSVDDITARLDKLFGGAFAKDGQADAPAIVLSSVHKAKGLEWDRVFLLCETFKDRNQEEKNIRYVAITRARQTLFYVGAGKDASGEEKRAINDPSAVAEPPKELAKTEESAVLPLPGAAAPAPAKSEPGATVPADPFLAERNGLTPAEFGFEPGVLWESPEPGHAWLAPGTVACDAAGKEWVSVRLSGTCAKMVCLEKQSRTITYREKGTMDEKSKTISSGNRSESWSRQVGKEMIVRRMDAEELKQFLGGESRGRREKIKPAGENQNEGSEEMKTKKVKKESNGRINRLEMAIELAKAGKSEAAIGQAIEKATGEKNSKSTLYLIGREWRRVHEQGRHFGGAAATPAKKKKSPPARKTAVKSAAKKSLPKNPSAKKVSALAIPPRPAKPVEAAPVAPAAAAPAEAAPAQ